MLFNKHKLSEEYTFLLGLAIKTITSTNPDSISVDDVKFLTILHIYYISNGRNVPIKTTQLIYCSLTPLIYNLDNFVLKFITEISKEVPETISILAVNLFPSAILQEIQRSNLSYEINIENIPIFETIKRNNHEEVIMQFSTQKNINFEFNTKQILPDRMSYQDIFDINFICKLSLISLFFKTNLNLIESFINNSFDFLSTIDKKHYMHFVLCICIIMNDIKPNQYFLVFIHKLYTSLVFDSRISIYHDTEDSFLSTIRWSAFDVLNIESTAFVFNALEILFCHPYMYCELLLRLSIGHTYLQVEFKKEIIELLIDHFHEYKEISNERTILACGNIILFVSRLLTDIHYLNNFFSSEHQTTIFLSCLFEHSLENFTIHVIRSYLTNTEVFSSNLCSLLGNCLRICCLSPSESGLPVYINILSALNDVQKIRKQVCEYLISLRSILCSNLCEICHRTDYEHLEEILYQCLNFFTSSSQIVKATQEEVSSFETMLEIFKNRKIPKRLFNETIQVIAGQFLSSYAPKYIITEPNFLRFMLQIYKDKDFKIAIKFIQDLCSHASVNIIICHQYRIDILLIELLSKQRLLEHPNLEYVHSCLDLFKTICSFMSSVTVSQRYVSLFAPLNNNNISYLEPVFIKGLTDILQQTYRIPSGFIELKPKGQKVTINGLNRYDLNNPFCFVTWFRINYSVPKYSPNIFTIYDSNHNIIQGTISCDEITITVRNGITRSIGKVEEQMPLNTWTFLSILFITVNERFEAFVNFNNRSRSFCLPFPLVKFAGDAKIVVGGADIPSGFEVKKFVSLSSFGILNINSNDQSSEIESIGPQLDKMPQTNYTFLVRVTSANKVLNLSLITKQENISLSTTGTPSHQISMIYDCLVNMSGVDLLLPLFSLIDFTFPNGQPFSDSFQLIYELLFIVIVNSEIAQKNMSETNCVEILEYLLQNNDKKLLNYVTFNKFYLLLQKINDTGLQFKLAKYILLNYNLWASSSEFNQIIKSWHRKLIPFIANLKIKVFDFIEISSLLVMNKCDNEIKKHLTDVLLDIASIEFKQNDLTVLIAHIAKVSAKENCLFLLNLMEKILMLQNNPLANLDCSDLHHIIFVIGLRDKQITMKMLSIIVIASRILKNISLYEICDSIIQLLRNDDANNELYDFLFDLVSNCSVHGLLSLLSWCSLTLGEEKVKNTFNNLKPDEKFICNFSWMTWSLISAIVYPNTSVYVFNFLIEVSPKCWLAVDANLCFLESVFKYNCEEFRRSFISILSNRLVMNYGSEEEMNNYYHILLMYLTRHRRSPNKALHDLLREHLNYQDKNTLTIKNQKENEISQPQNVKNSNENFDKNNEKSDKNVKNDETSNETINKVNESSNENIDKNNEISEKSDKVEEISHENFKIDNHDVKEKFDLDHENRNDKNSKLIPKSISMEEIFNLEISSPLDFYFCNNNFDGVKFEIFGLRVVKNGT
ncbi:platelet formation protein family, partial [Trichomonas vaginalis G3]|uniref:platelet formation protein family n=1 Tax=Trichomonas vaginalis (strain ATCC PRA-98 / G3) TaxID=412133 RepID=UPI0021E58F1D